MPAQARVFGWLFACVIVLAGTSFAHAWEKSSWKSKLDGTWDNAATGENMKISRAAIGWEAWLSNSGEARISATSDDGSNVKIEGKGLSCEYYLTMVNDNLINLQLRDSDPAGACLKGTFFRVLGIKHAAKPEHEHHGWKAARRHHCKCD